MDSHRLDRIRTLVHPLTALAISFPFVWVLDTVLRLSVIPILFVPPPQSVLLVGFVLAVVSLITTNRIERTQTAAFAFRVREIVALLVLLVPVLMLVAGHLGAGDLNPVKADIVYGLVVVMLCWTVTVVMHSRLQKRERFLALLVGKAPGQELQDAARTMNTEAGESDRAVLKTRRAAIVFAVLGVVLLIAIEAVTPAEQAYLRTIVTVQLVLSTVVVIVCNGFVWEDAVLVTGTAGQNRTLGRRFRWNLLIAIVVVLVALPIAGRDPVVPTSVIESLLESLSNRSELSSSDEVDASVLFREPEEGATLGLMGTDAGVGVMTSSRAVQAVARVFGLLIASAAGIGLLYFLLRPLFSKEFRRGLAELSLRGILSRLGQRIADAAGSVVLSIRSLFRRTARIVAETRRAVVEARRTARTLRQQRERDRRAEPRHVGRLVKAFARIAQFGSNAGIPYKVWMGPREYIDTLSRATPEHAEGLQEIGKVFELLVYGPESPSPERVNAFSSEVKRIVGQAARSRNG